MEQSNKKYYWGGAIILLIIIIVLIVIYIRNKKSAIAATALATLASNTIPPVSNAPSSVIAASAHAIPATISALTPSNATPAQQAQIVAAVQQAHITTVSNAATNAANALPVTAYGSTKVQMSSITSDGKNIDFISLTGYPFPGGKLPATYAVYKAARGFLPGLNANTSIAVATALGNQAIGLEGQTDPSQDPNNPLFFTFNTNN